MKNILFLALLLPFIGNGQAYRNRVEQFEAAYDGQGYSYSANVGHGISTHESGFLQFYLDIFKATQDKKYLDKFIIHAKRVQERRDDNLYALSFSEIEGFPYQFSSNYTISNLTDNNVSSPFFGQVKSRIFHS